MSSLLKLPTLWTHLAIACAAVLGWLASACSGVLLAAETSKPNFVVILSDDLAGQPRLLQAPIPRSRLPISDRLAREGRRFTNAYGPRLRLLATRYGLMTGRYTGAPESRMARSCPANGPLHIETDRLTLASLCKVRATAPPPSANGHLGMGTEAKRTDWSGQLKPGRRWRYGFDYFFGSAPIPGAAAQPLLRITKVHHKIPGESVVVNGNRGRATTSGIKAQWQGSRDHAAAHGKSRRLDRSAGSRQTVLSLLTLLMPCIVPVAPNRKFTGSKFGIYGDFIHELDWSVGEILAALDRRKLADNTLVIFTSDNGGVVKPQ